jgi:hypothetical protein
VDARRTHVRDLLQRREEAVHGDVVAAQHVALAGAAALEGREVPVRDVLDVRVRPQPVARSDDPRHLPRRWSVTIFTTMLPSVTSPGP